MVFAHLVHTQLGPLLDFLCSLPGPTGKPALEFVMAEWTSRQHLFYGQYEGKVRWGLLASLLSPATSWRLGAMSGCPSLYSSSLFFIANLYDRKSCHPEMPQRQPTRRHHVSSSVGWRPSSASDLMQPSTVVASSPSDPGL